MHVDPAQQMAGVEGDPHSAPHSTSTATEPSTTSTVLAIHTAKARRLPMRPTDAVVAEAGAGLVGDRYHGSKHRHVTLQSADDLAAASAVLGSLIDAGATRRNVTVSGPVPHTPGARIRVGDVELEVVRKAAPCRLLDDWIAPGAMKAMHERGGAVCRILESGTIRVGDAVVG